MKAEVRLESTFQIALPRGSANRFARRWCGEKVSDWPAIICANKVTQDVHKTDTMDLRVRSVSVLTRGSARPRV